MNELNDVPAIEHIDLAQLERKLKHSLYAGKRDPHGEPEGVVHNPSLLDENYKASTVILCKDIADLLVKHYPGYSWIVQPDDFGGVFNIFCQNLHNQYGYTIRMVDIMEDPRRREAVRAGGEILARFGMPHRFDRHAILSAPRDMVGNCIPDISDFPDRKRVRDAEVAKKLATGEWSLVEIDGERYVRTNG